MSKLTKEMIQDAVNCENLDCTRCSVNEYKGSQTAFCIKRIAQALLEEIEKPKVWDDAVDDAVVAKITWLSKNQIIKYGEQVYTRKTPKTREQELAEEVTTSILMRSAPTTEFLENIIVQALIKARKEWEAGR
jgi:hypothetical protein